MEYELVWSIYYQKGELGEVTHSGESFDVTAPNVVTAAVLANRIIDTGTLGGDLHITSIMYEGRLITKIPTAPQPGT